ncbi:hypothetical protein SAMN04488570_0279 [Nocardioides scoriae]|uniref:Uncharacterized protein n=1 Tax=Nocardioides scoriae TaxID=642780 RepID=A0A1H1LM49_9ACTN|nr:hypothetical protein [Nocardioides scoriae]SDR75606.1 hypothetical protein SAMN04488570_0279 [Nocardioides scoriae]
MARSSTHEWFRFLDVTTEDEAAEELMRWSAALKVVYDDLARQCRGLGDAPGGDLYEVLNVARSTLSEGIDILDDAVRRFRAGEHRVA